MATARQRVLYHACSDLTQTLVVALVGGPAAAAAATHASHPLPPPLDHYLPPQGGNYLLLPRAYLFGDAIHARQHASPISLREENVS